MPTSTLASPSHRGRHHSSSDLRLHGGCPTCPVCLSLIRKSSLAVLRRCMHEFCVPCIQKWSLLQRFCPLCKQNFHGWYYNIRSSSVYEIKDLSRQTSPPQEKRPERRLASRPLRRHSVTSERRTQPLPWVRSFRTRQEELQHHLPKNEFDKSLEWRASIYTKGLRAVPPPLHSRKVHIKQEAANDPERIARIQKRLEPWIRRELCAILSDSDQSVLVHLVLSLWINVLLHQEQNKNLENQSSSRKNADIKHIEAISEMRPFLDDKADLFWHELKCFAASHFSLRAYDSVVQYTRFTSGSSGS